MSQLFTTPLEQLPMARAFAKLAQFAEPQDAGDVPREEQQQKQQPDIKQPILHALKAVAAPAAAFGVGTAAGALAGHGLTKGLGLGPSATPVLRKAAPFLGGGLALALQQYHSRAGKELSRAYEAHKSQSARSVPAE